jgi:hypothetical protein
MKKVINLLILVMMLASCSQKQPQTNAEQKTAQADTLQGGGFKPANIREQMIYQRGIEAAIWGMPVVNYQSMYREFAKLHGTYNQIVYWPKLLDWKNQTLTPNPDVIYIMPFINTKDAGPVVLEIPPADDGILNGSIMDCWQAAIEDIGPGGVDKGKGGKYLFLPPEYDKAKIPAGYIPMQSATYQGYALIRSVLKSGSDADIAKAVKYAKRIKMYPLSKAANPPETSFVDASNAVYDSSIKYDASFYNTLDTMVQSQPLLERDRAMIEQLQTIGIKKGKTFNPDARTQEILGIAVKDAKKWLEENYAALPPFYKDTHWFFPVGKEFVQCVQSYYRVPEIYPIDNRGVAYMIAFFSAKHLGESQFYLMQTNDKDNKPLAGNGSYKLHVPANVPVIQYWSITVYNRDTHTFIRNVSRQGRSSQSPGLKKNSDGSVDLYISAAAPPGEETNWIPTDANGRFEILARFYGPTKKLYDMSWKLNDIERTQ